MSFSGATFYVPKNWNLIKSVDCSLGGIEEKNVQTQTDGIPVKLIGNVKFSGIEIIYV